MHTPYSLLCSTLVKCLALHCRASSSNLTSREIPGGCSKSPDRPYSPPSLLHNGYQVFPAVKRPRRDIDHPPPSSAKVKERVELCLFSRFGPSWPVVRQTLLHNTITQFDRNLTKAHRYFRKTCCSHHHSSTLTTSHSKRQQSSLKMFTHQSCLFLHVFLWSTLDHSESTKPKMDFQLICAQHIHLVTQFSEGGTL